MGVGCFAALWAAQQQTLNQSKASNPAGVMIINGSLVGTKSTDNPKLINLTGKICFNSMLTSGAEVAQLWASSDPEGMTVISSIKSFNFYPGGNYPQCDANANLINSNVTGNDFSLSVLLPNDLSSTYCPQIYLNFYSNRKPRTPGFAFYSPAEHSMCPAATCPATAPTNLTATVNQTDPTKVDLSWAVSGGTQVALVYGPSNTCNLDSTDIKACTSVSVINATVPYMIQNLSADTDYVWEIINSTPACSNKTTGTFTTTATGNTCAITNPYSSNTSAITSTEATIAWKPASQQGSKQILYVGTNSEEVNGGCVNGLVGSNPSASCILQQDLDKIAHSYRLTGLTSGATYYWQVVNYSVSDCQKKFTSIAFFTTTTGTGGSSCPVTVIAPSNPSTVNINQTTATIKWNPGTGGTKQKIYIAKNIDIIKAGCPAGVAATCYLSREDTSTQRLNTISLGIPGSMSPLEAGTTYYWRIVNYSPDCGNTKILDSSFTTLPGTGGPNTSPTPSPSLSPTNNPTPGSIDVAVDVKQGINPVRIPNNRAINVTICANVNGLCNQTVYKINRFFSSNGTLHFTNVPAGNYIVSIDPKLYDYSGNKLTENITDNNRAMSLTSCAAAGNQPLQCLITVEAGKLSSITPSYLYSIPATGSTNPITGSIDVDVNVKQGTNPVTISGDKFLKIAVCTNENGSCVPNKYKVDKMFRQTSTLHFTDIPFGSYIVLLEPHLYDWNGNVAPGNITDNDRIISRSTCAAPGSDDLQCQVGVSPQMTTPLTAYTYLLPLIDQTGSCPAGLTAPKAKGVDTQTNNSIATATIRWEPGKEGTYQKIFLAPANYEQVVNRFCTGDNSDKCKVNQVLNADTQAFGFKLTTNTSYVWRVVNYNSSDSCFAAMDTQSFHTLNNQSGEIVAKGTMALLGIFAVTFGVYTIFLRK